MKEEVGKRIEKVRTSMHMTKEEFARILNISGQYLGIVERGKSQLSYEKLKILCELTGLSADYFLFGKEEGIEDKASKELEGLTGNEIQEGCEMLCKLAKLLRNKKQSRSCLKIFVWFENNILTSKHLFGKIWVCRILQKRGGKCQMKSTGIVRKIDELGRVVIPMELRHQYKINEKDPLEIFVDGSSIILKKHEQSCTFCGSTKKVEGFGDKLICPKCIEKISKLNK